MSRIGKLPIPLPASVKVEVGEGSVTISGPKGSLTKPFDPCLGIAVDGATLVETLPTDEQRHRSLHGLTRTILANMVEGVTNGYARTLDVVGVGYRALMAGSNLSLSVGYSHGIEIPPPPGVTFEAGVEQQTRTPFVIVRGIDKELVGQTAAQIRSVRRPEPYKGKGIRYRGEQIRRKAGKQGKAGGKGGKK